MRVGTQNNGVRVVCLHGNRLEEWPSGGVGLCEAVTELDLSNNRLRALPADLRLLRHLVLLDVRSNRLVQVADEIGQLSSLTALYAQNNW